MAGENSSTINELKSRLGSVLELVEQLESVGDKQNYLGELPHRVIHLKDNPYDLELRRQRREFEKLSEENERLRARLDMLESGNNADVTRRIDEAVNNARENELLSRRLEELRRREDKILKSFGKTIREFREVVYLLTGYRFDALKDRIYRLTNMYAEDENDKLLFEISPEGAIQLLQTEYSGRLTHQISTYLENSDSFPAFLSSITLDLFKSSTQIAPESMCLSTTVQPNPNCVIQQNK